MHPMLNTAVKAARKPQWLGPAHGDRFEPQYAASQRFNLNLHLGSATRGQKSHFGRLGESPLEFRSPLDACLS